MEFSYFVSFVFLVGNFFDYGDGFGVGRGPILGVPDGVGLGVVGGTRDGVTIGVGVALGLGVTLGLGFGVGEGVGDGEIVGNGDGEASVELGIGALKLKFESMPRFVLRFTF